METLKPAPDCWIVTDGKIGLDNQCLGLAEALGVQPAIKHVSMRSPWRLMFPIVRYLHPHAFRPGDALAPPWPDLLITGGRSGAAVSLFVKKASGGKTITVHIQNPHIPPGRFDLLVAGEHDGLAEGSHVAVIKGALNRISNAKMQAAMERFPGLAALPRPRLAVLLGGANRCFSFGAAEAATLAAQLKALKDGGSGLMITSSRRTGEENTHILRQALAGQNAFFWDGQGENPYFAMLGYADHILVTSDSISMVSEAATTGKPVHVVQLPGGDRKFNQFHQAMREAGMTRPFDGRLDEWRYPAFQETLHIAGLVKILLDRKLSR
jgi:mitochondrial fission protein ELM1